MKKAEIFPIVNEEGEVVGKASREECHSGSFLLHPVVHLHVFNSNGDLFLQKRALNKDIQPGKWDTSVGGHVDYGEDVITALKREVKEELGIQNFEPTFIKMYPFKSNQEYELINCFYCIYDGEITPDISEISEGRFWSFEDIKSQIGTDVFTPNFEQEFNSVISNLHLKKEC